MLQYRRPALEQAVVDVLVVAGMLAPVEDNLAPTRECCSRDRRARLRRRKIAH